MTKSMEFFNIGFQDNPNLNHNLNNKDHTWLSFLSNDKTYTISTNKIYNTNNIPQKLEVVHRCRLYNTQY